MATPIETNTEELQEILNTVYNLPMAGGGSSEPDLVIGLNVENPKMCPDGSSAPCRSLTHMTLDDVSILSGSISATAEKVRQGLPVRVLLNAVYFYWSDHWYRAVGETTDVQMSYTTGEYPDDTPAGLWVTFFLGDMPGGGDHPCYLRIFFNLASEEATWYRAVTLAVN